MENVIQSMPTNGELVKRSFTTTEWLTYYKNIWTRNLIARTIDVQTDTVLKAKTPDEVVMCEDGQPRAVKERIELRKIAVQDAINLIASIDAMIAVAQGGEVDFASKFWSKDALAVAPDMISKPEGEKKRFKVVNEAGIVYRGIGYAKDSIVDLEVDAEDTTHFISNGFVTEEVPATGAVSPEAKI